MTEVLWAGLKRARLGLWAALGRHITDVRSAIVVLKLRIWPNSKKIWPPANVFCKSAAQYGNHIFPLNALTYPEIPECFKF